MPKAPVVRDALPVVLGADVDLTPVALAWLAPPTQDRWVDVGSRLQYPASGVMWWVGDWLNSYPRDVGKVNVPREAYDHAKGLGYERKTLRVAGWVCRRVNSSIRIDELTFLHHRLVASLPPDQQRYWLALAVSEKWSVAELRAAMRGSRPAPALPTGQYRVVYADPPWSYNNSGFEQSAAQQYPTMTTEEICDMNIGALCGDPCALFLWIPAPLVPDGVRVMAAWGFDYKTCMVWVKDRAPGMGWFLQTKHELLLIGTRGDGAQPAVKPDSVIEASVRRHSQKPDAFAELIEHMYEGPWVELFARRARPGWDVWGNEV